MQTINRTQYSSEASTLEPACVLIVDDNIDNLNLLSSMLPAPKYQVRRAISGTFALEAMKAFQPDLILLDITMPEMDGYEVFRCLQANEKTAKIPIIFISALADNLDKTKAFSMGAVDYIEKPFAIAEVITRVDNHLKLQTAQAEILRLQQVIEQLDRGIES